MEYDREVELIARLEEMLPQKFPPYPVEEDRSDDPLHKSAKFARIDSPLHQGSETESCQNNSGDSDTKFNSERREKEMMDKVSEMNSWGYLGVSVVLSPFASLPTELIHKIFSFLSVKDLGR